MSDPRPLTRRAKFILGIIFLGLTALYPRIVPAEYLIPYFQIVAFCFAILLLGVAAVDAIAAIIKGKGGTP